MNPTVMEWVFSLWLILAISVCLLETLKSGSSEPKENDES